MKPVKIGVQLEPPTLIYVYKFWGRLRLRKMPLRHVWPSTSTKFILEDLRTRHEVLAEVPDDKLVEMIELVKTVRSGISFEEAVEQLRAQQKTYLAARVGSKREKANEEDTDFDAHDDLPLDELDDDW